jgi:hypothetical protein
MSKCECYVSAVSEERKKMFLEISDDGTIPIRCPVPAGTMTHPTLKQPVQFFEMAIERLTLDQRTRLIKQLARRFNLPETEIDRELDKQSCPVRWDSEVIVHWCNLHLRCVL